MKLNAATHCMQEWAVAGFSVLMVEHNQGL